MLNLSVTKRWLTEMYYEFIGSIINLLIYKDIIILLINEGIMNWWNVSSKLR